MAPPRKDAKRLVDEAYRAAQGTTAGLTEIDEYTRVFQEQMQRVTKQIETELIDLAGSLDTKDGRFLANEENFSRLSGVREQIVGAARPELQLASDYIRAFDDLVDHVREQFGILQIPARFTAINREILDELKADQFARFHELSTATREALRRSVYDAVVGQGEFKALRNNISAALRKDIPDGKIVTRTGMVRRINFQAQAETIAHDAIIQHGRAITEEAVRDTGIERFYYGGPDDGVTRKFCHDLINGTGEQGSRAIAPRIFTAEARAQLDNGQTGAGSVAVACGGYRCRHAWIPLTDEMAVELIAEAKD